ncbi:hypothetical protein EAH89_19555 [Roseomonas nepalensis]|uniref:Uncharacterized protein n=2 Tax=Muricoccus nepalensis TaxID=1854500 RepID=A0A502FQY2_9PROT|nr:hypothetical protein EAH89_19555 [Roseomonas nepalensis]
MRVEIERAGQPPEWLPPSVLDWLRWRWRRAWMDGKPHPTIWTAALAGLRERVRACEPPPAGWAPRDMDGDTALYVAGQPASNSRRRQRDTGYATGAWQRPGRAGSASGAKGPPSMAELLNGLRAPGRAALAAHANALAPFLAGVAGEVARERVALAYAAYLAGQIGLSEWLVELHAERRP